MAYPVVARQHPLVWLVLFPFWWYGELTRQIWACVKAR
jgi:hypothetical protein